MSNDMRYTFKIIRGQISRREGDAEFIIGPDGKRSRSNKRRRVVHYRAGDEIKMTIAAAMAFGMDKLQQVYSQGVVLDLNSKDKKLEHQVALASVKIADPVPSTEDDNDDDNDDDDNNNVTKNLHQFQTGHVPAQVDVEREPAPNVQRVRELIAEGVNAKSPAQISQWKGSVRMAKVLNHAPQKKDDILDALRAIVEVHDNGSDEPEC